MSSEIRQQGKKIVNTLLREIGAHASRSFPQVVVASGGKTFFVVKQPGGQAFFKVCNAKAPVLNVKRFVLNTRSGLRGFGGFNVTGDGRFYGTIRSENIDQDTERFIEWYLGDLDEEDLVEIPGGGDFGNGLDVDDLDVEDLVDIPSGRPW